MSYDFLNRFKPTPDELQRLVFRRVDDSMLREIAAADYGQDVEPDHAPLFRIAARRRQSTPAMFQASSSPR